MKLESLKKANDLLPIIKTTREAIDTIESMLSKERTRKESWLDDGIYNLTICEHRDGSGDNANLVRYFGNKSLLGVILEELQRQLVVFNNQFDEL